jgi:hypothetical protein
MRGRTGADDSIASDGGEGVMEEEVRQQIEKIRAGMECPKGFSCCKSGFGSMCKAKDFGLEEYVDCLSDEPAGCRFAIPFGAGHLCKCRLRVYIAKNLKM